MNSVTQDNAEFLYHDQCDKCGSSDGKAVYSSGSSYCFVCTAWGRSTEELPHQSSKTKRNNMALLEYEFTDLKKRRIPESICKQYRYGVGQDTVGNQVQIANYFDAEKQIVAQKLRTPDKDFKFIGDAKNAMMFGQQLWANTGKKITICEGELDCLSVATAFDGKWATVSLKNGASSAKKELSQHMEFLNGYEEIYLWFDNDEAGRAAVDACVHIFPHDKLRIVRHPDYKDANEILVAKGKAEIVKTFYAAEQYKPDDIKSPSDLMESLNEPAEIGFSWYYEGLTNLLYGRRYGEIVTVGAGVSVGKTDFCMAQIDHDIKNGHKVCTFMLEQSVKETLLRICGKRDGVMYHLPTSKYEPSKLLETAESMEGSLFMFDNFGANDYATIASKIRYMNMNHGCRIFYIDNLTQLNAMAMDERRSLDALMADIAGLAKELNIWVLLVSHLNPVKSGPSLEEGGKVDQSLLTGSRAISRWSYVVLGIERNTLHEDPEERNKGLIRVLKDRFSGEATGQTIGFRYDRETGLVQQLDGFYKIEHNESEEDDNNDF